jgi:hypothetical protein
VTFSASWTGRPISSNGRLINGSGRWVPNGLYGAFLKSMAWELTAARLKQGWTMERGRVSVLLAIICPHGMDHHNLIKPALDALQRAEIIENDREVWDIRAVRVGIGRDGRIDFTVAAYAEAPLAR